MIREVIEQIRLHQTRAQAALKEIRTWPELNEEIFYDFDKIKTIDSFIYRFGKVQDMIGSKLFPLLLQELGEYEENMALIDMLDKLEKFSIIPSAKEWIEFRKLRNSLTHEYPSNEDEIIEGIQLAIEAFEKIEKVFDTIIHHPRLTPQKIHNSKN